MILRCPQCGTVYHLDQHLLEPKGSKVRCTRCGHIFWVDPPERRDEPSPDKEEGRSLRPFPEEQDEPSRKIGRMGKAFRLLGVVFLLFLLVFSMRFFYLQYRHPAWKWTEALAEAFFLPSDPQGRRDIRLISHRRDFLENEKIGRILVIEGEIINGYATTRQAIKIRGALKTSDSRVADARDVYAGWTLSRDEILALSPEDLQRFQAAQTETRAKSLGVLPGKALPFQILFPRPPQGATHVTIEVLSSRPASETSLLPSSSLR